MELKVSPSFHHADQVRESEDQAVNRAVAMYTAFRDASGEGASTFPHGVVITGSGRFYISYNGRVWTDRKFTKPRKTLIEMRRELEEKMKDWAKEDHDDDMRAKTQGFTHKFVGWVHPKCGDDRQIAFYQKGAITKSDAQAFLKRRRSEILDDYRVTEL